jgi:hypothetical protein
MDPVKELALERAVQVYGHTADHGLVLLAAAQFEAYLRGSSANDAFVCDALGNKLSDASVEALGRYK